MKLKKSLSLCMLFILTITMLFSCKIKSNTQNEDPSSDGSDTTVNENCVWGKGVAPCILLDAYSAENLEIDSWFSTLYQNCEVFPTFISDTTKETAHEIVVGRLNRDISEKAYHYLERALEPLGGESDGWVIYTNGKSVCIAYEGLFAFNDAIKYFNENYLQNKLFAPNSGIIASNTFFSEKYIDEIRNNRRETELNALVPELGSEAVSALKKLFSLYTDDLYKWIVDLYDPSIGGFYFSNSGRNTEGFLPDIESTAQIISFLSESGLISSNTCDAVPYEIGQQILLFAQGLQSSEDGFFYHPQWGKDISTERRGRDLGWATSMIRTFGGSPLYDAPNGVKGSLGAPGQNSATSYLTGRVSTSRVAAVSRIATVSKASLPSYLKSLDAWAEYIDDLNIPYHSYSAGNTLAAQHSQISLAGQEYIDYLINYLNKIQNPDTALWEASNSINDDYYAVNGLMKIASCYNYFKQTIPNPETVIRSCMAVMLRLDGDAHVCSVYNPWISLYYVFLSVENSEGKAKASELRNNIVLPRAAELIEASTEKMAKYRMLDGGFAYFGPDGEPANVSQSAIVGCAIKSESDVNSTLISTGMVRRIFHALGCKEVMLFGEEDYVLFKERWLELGTIVKEPWKDNVSYMTFDEYKSSLSTIERGVVLDPAEYVENVVADTEITYGDDNNYKWFSSAVVPDPASSTKGDLVLKVQTYTYKNEHKTVAYNASYTSFKAQGIPQMKNCYVFEGDIFFESFDGSTCVGQIFFSSASAGGDPTLSLNLNKYTANGKTYLAIAENYQGLDGVRDEKVVSGIPSGEWIKLRIETYKIKLDDNIDIKCKIYVNGVYKGTCDAGYSRDGKFIEREIKAVNYFHYRHSASVVYFDNVMVQGIKKDYVSEDDYTGGPPEGPSKIDFEDYMTYGETTYIYAPLPSSPNGSCGVQSVIGADGKETLAYVYDSNLGAEDVFRLQAYGTDVDEKLTSANAFTYDADMKIEFNADELNCQIKLQLGSTGSTRYHAYNMLISLDKESGRIMMLDGGEKATGPWVITEVNNGDWFTIRIEYYYISAEEMLAITYINGKAVYISNNYNFANTYDSSAWPVFKPGNYTLPSGSKIGGGIDKIMFTTLSRTDVTIYLDNCIIRRCELTPPEINEEDYTSRYDKDVSGDDEDNESTEPSNPGGNTSGGSENPDDNIGGGSSGSGEDDIPSGTVTPPTGNDIIDNLPEGTWKD